MNNIIQWNSFQKTAAINRHFWCDPSLGGWTSFFILTKRFKLLPVPWPTPTKAAVPDLYQGMAGNRKQPTPPYLGPPGQGNPGYPAGSSWVPRPGAPDMRGEGPGPSQHPLLPHQQRPRRRGPVARARHKVRHQAWLQKKEKVQQQAAADHNSDTDIQKVSP